MLPGLLLNVIIQVDTSFIKLHLWALRMTLVFPGVCDKNFFLFLLLHFYLFIFLFRKSIITGSVHPRDSVGPRILGPSTYPGEGLGS